MASLIDYRLYRVMGPIGLCWVSYLVGWVGFGLMKWTHGQLWARVGKYLLDKIRREALKKIFPLHTLVFSLPTLPYVTVVHPAYRSTLVPT